MNARVKFSRVILPLGFGLATLVGFANAGDVVGSSGTIKKVPGYPGKELKYRVGAVKTGKKTAHFWLQLKNETDTEIKIVVCSMVNLKKPRVKDSDYTIKKNSNGKWDCDLKPGGDGPESFHFGCKQVTVPAGGKVDAFDEVATFSSNVCDAAGKSLLGTVYFDVLKDCPIVDCARIKGARKFLSPATPAGHADWANVWAGGKKYEDLTDTGLDEADWPTGNWITMNKTSTDTYPARMVGTLTGAPANAQVVLAFADGTQHVALVLPDPFNLPCGGRPLALNIPFSVPSSVDLHDAITIHMPFSPCGFVPEQTVMRLNAEILAEPGAPVYLPGEFMYGVDLFWVRDTQPPLVGFHHLQPTSTGLHVYVEATDDTTIASGASLVYSVEGETLVEVPINFAIPSELEGVMMFEDTLCELPRGVPLDCVIKVVDEVGNTAETPVQTLILPPKSPLDGCGPDLFGSPAPPG